jgi:hypothetical protein
VCFIPAGWAGRGGGIEKPVAASDERNDYCRPCTRAASMHAVAVAATATSPKDESKKRSEPLPPPNSVQLIYIHMSMCAYHDTQRTIDFLL